MIVENVLDAAIVTSYEPQCLIRPLDVGVDEHFPRNFPQTFSSNIFPPPDVPPETGHFPFKHEKLPKLTAIEQRLLYKRW
jgi:hypothetical protein